MAMYVERVKSNRNVLQYIARVLRAKAKESSVYSCKVEKNEVGAMEAVAVASTKQNSADSVAAPLLTPLALELLFKLPLPVAVIFLHTVPITSATAKDSDYAKSPKRPDLLPLRSLLSWQIYIRDNISKPPKRVQ